MDFIINVGYFILASLLFNLAFLISSYGYHFQVILGQNGNLDTDGNELPRLVYVSREKRPGYNHHKKAGAMNALVCNALSFIFSLSIHDVSVYELKI